MQARPSCLRLPQKAVFRGQLVLPLAAASSGGRMAPSLSGPACAEERCTAQGWRRPLHTGGGRDGAGAAMVALGKFDALHKGHAALAIAAAHLGGSPWLVSFSGMAEVLGWPWRLPLVARCDRERVLRSWAAACGGQAPRECAIPFAQIRSMSPEEFVRLLAEELQVSGVVVGRNYRFGYRASGTTEDLERLAPQYDIKVRVLDLVGSSCAGSLSEGEGCLAGETVSSSRVRAGLAEGDLGQVEECLGRPYRLAASLQGACLTEGPEGAGIRLGLGAYLNQPPGPGRYRVSASWCTDQGCTLDCGPEGSWQDARLAIDEAGATVTLAGDGSGAGAGAGLGPGGVSGWGQQQEGVLVLDLRSRRE